MAIVLVAIFWFFVLSSFKRKSGYSSLSPGQLAEILRKNKAELDAQLVQEAEEAIAQNRKAIRNALERGEKYVVTLPSAWRLIIDEAGKVRLDPCSENLFV